MGLCLPSAKQYITQWVEISGKWVFEYDRRKIHILFSISICVSRHNKLFSALILSREH